MPWLFKGRLYALSQATFFDDPKLHAGPLWRGPPAKGWLPNSGQDTLGTPSVPMESGVVLNREALELQLVRSAGSASETAAETELSQLMARVRMLAPQLSPEALSTAGNGLVELAARRDSEPSPAQPRLLAFGPEDVRPTDGDSEVGSVGSLDGVEAADNRDFDDEAEAPEQQGRCLRVAPTVLGDTECHVPHEQVTYEDWDHQGWAPGVAYPADIPPAVFAAAAEDEEAEGDEACVPGKMSGWKGARDLMGLGDCQHVYCEKCDLNLTQDNVGCKVTSMALTGRVQRVLAKHEKLHQAKPWSDRDKREARHAVYKAIIHLLAVLLAARCPGKRVRLPECLVSQPNVRVRVRLLAAVERRDTTQYTGCRTPLLLENHDYSPLFASAGGATRRREPLTSDCE